MICMCSTMNGVLEPSSQMYSPEKLNSVAAPYPLGNMRLEYVSLTPTSVPVRRGMVRPVSAPLPSAKKLSRRS